jgi:hypothetical protein
MSYDSYGYGFARRLGEYGQRRLARSYSEPRKVIMSFGTPDAYVEWGAPSQFSTIDEPNDDHDDDDSRKRYTFSEEARYWKSSFVIDDSSEGHLSQHGTLETIVSSWAMSGPDNTQHRFYLDHRLAGAEHTSGYAPIIPVPAFSPSFSNRYDFLPFKDD